MSLTSPPSPDAAHDASGRGLEICRSVATAAAPRNFRENVERFCLTPIRSIGIDDASSLKASLWQSDIEESTVSGDPAYASLILHRGGARVWRNNERVPAKAGSVTMQTFEHCRWRFEGNVNFAHIFVPFALIESVSESLFERELAREQLWIPMGTGDERLCGTIRAVQSRLFTIEPTTLILDSWALMLSEILVRHFSSHAGRHARASFGRIPARGIAHVVDFIEAHIDQDLDLASLSRVASMSVYHFARRFKETLGVTPHAYVVARRVRRAQGLLKHRNSRPADVAAACGFSSQAHLTTAFRHGLGVTPGAYRRAQHPRIQDP